MLVTLGQNQPRRRALAPKPYVPFHNPGTRLCAVQLHACANLLLAQPALGTLPTPQAGIKPPSLATLPLPERLTATAAGTD